MYCNLQNEQEGRAEAIVFPLCFVFIPLYHPGTLIYIKLGPSSALCLYAYCSDVWETE